MHGLANSPIGCYEIELRLEVQPKLGINAKSVTKTQSGVARHGTLASNELADPVRWYIDLARECR